MTQYPSSPQAVCDGECESIRVIGDVNTAVQACDKFFSDGSRGMLCAACGFHWAFHRQVEIPIADSFWPTLGPLGGTTESPWEEYFWSGNESSLSPLPPPPPTPPPAAKAPSEAGGAPARRQRTKFTAKQVAEMEECARASGWRRRKRDRAGINEFCQGIGVDPEKYKTWLKNKKAAQKKRG